MATIDELRRAFHEADAVRSLAFEAVRGSSQFRSMPEGSARDEAARQHSDNHAALQAATASYESAKAALEAAWQAGA